MRLCWFDQDLSMAADPSLAILPALILAVLAGRWAWTPLQILPAHSAIPLKPHLLSFTDCRSLSLLLDAVPNGPFIMSTPKATSNAAFKV